MSNIAVQSARRLARSSVRLAKAAVLASTFVGCASRPGVAAPPDEPVLAIVDVTVIPMTDPRTILSGRTVIVRNGMIAEVGPAADTRVPRGSRVIDGRGRWLTPGLHDMHVHLEYGRDPAVLGLFVGHGVTTVRSMDGRPFILDWRSRIRTGEWIGPRIVTAGPIIDGSPPARSDNLAAADPPAARKAVRDQAAAGYDFVKTYTNLSEEAWRAALAEAGALGLRVSGHPPRGVTVAEGARAQWSLEHLGDFAGAVARDGARPPGWARSRLATDLDPAKVAAVAAAVAGAGAWVVPTTVEQDRALAPAAVVTAWLEEPSMQDVPPAVRELWRAQVARFTTRMDAEDFALLEKARANRLTLVGAMHRAGVRLVVGSDTPNAFVVPGWAVHQELSNFVEAGLTPGEALHAATAEPDRMLGRLGGAGSIIPGRRADLLLLTADPMKDLAALQRPAGLVLAGRWLGADELGALRRGLVRDVRRPPATPR